jgi:hypothetical protein
VVVKSQETTGGIDMLDWYSPVDAGFPPAPPPSVVPDGRWSFPTFGQFPTARRAIADFAPGTLWAQLVEEPRSNCATNRACLTLTDLTSGTDAAYMVAHVGANQDVLQCTILASHNEMGWRANVTTFCRIDRPFPALGQRGQVYKEMGGSATDCVNVRSQPGLGGQIVGCLVGGTALRIDGGPAYIAPVSVKDSPDGFWWHIEGRGWMANEYLRRSP